MIWNFSAVTYSEKPAIRCLSWFTCIIVYKKVNLMLKLEKHINPTELSIVPVQAHYLDGMLKLCKSQFSRQLQGLAELPEFWSNADDEIRAFLTPFAIGGRGYVLLRRGQLAGYLLYDAFDFHGEASAFFPIMAHAVEPEMQLTGYSLLYKTVSDQLVSQGILNHLISYAAPDIKQGQFWYELGFGMYLVDAYRKLEPITLTQKETPITVRRAGLPDLDLLVSLNDQAGRYYGEAPLFLHRDAIPAEQIKELLLTDQSAIFLAFQGQNVLGFINCRACGEPDCVVLTDPLTAVIEPLGAYLKPESRGLGAGSRLLAAAVDWARGQGLKQMHVDFESANFHANQFWLNYFTPAIHSVKRTLNRDAGKAYIPTGFSS